MAGAPATRAPVRDSVASAKSWFGKLKERLVWRSEFESLEQARKEIADYIDRYHRDRPR